MSEVQRLASREMRELARAYQRRGYDIDCQHTRDGDWLSVEDVGATLFAEQGGPVHLYLHDIGHVAVTSTRHAPLILDEYRDPYTEVGRAPTSPPRINPRRASRAARREVLFFACTIR